MILPKKNDEINEKNENESIENENEILFFRDQSVKLKQLDN